MHGIISNKIVILLILIFLGGFLRFFKLEEYPVQLNLDEVSQLYEAISISQTSKDVYGNNMPLVFPLFGVYAPGHYIYLTSLIIKVFGAGEITIRIPAAFFGTLVILSVYLFVLALFNNWKLAILSSFFIAISPSEIFYSRKSFEYINGHFFVFLGLSLILFYIKRDRIWMGIAGFISLAISTYTYTAHAVTVPFLIAAYLFIFKDKLVKKKLYALPPLFGVIFALPLIYLILTNSDLHFRANTIFISKDPELGTLMDAVKSENFLLTFLFQNKTYFDYTLQRYLYQFDPSYIFGTGLDLTNRGYLDVGPLYYFQIPLFIIGIIFLIRLRSVSAEKKFLLSLILLSVIAPSLTFESHSPHRSVMTFALFSVVSSAGLYWLIKLTKNSLIFFGLVVLIIFINFIYVFFVYTVNFPYEKSEYLYYPFKNVVLYTWSQYQNFDTIVFDPQFGEGYPLIGVGAHYYIGYYGDYPPGMFQKEYTIGSKPREIILDKFSIRQIYWPEDKDLKNTLIIVSPWSVPIDQIDKNLIIRQFNFYNGMPAFFAIKL